MQEQNHPVYFLLYLDSVIYLLQRVFMYVHRAQLFINQSTVDELECFVCVCAKLSELSVWQGRIV